MGHNKFIIDAENLKIRFMDFDNSFFVDLHGTGFSYKRHLSSDLSTSNFLFQKCVFKNL